MIRAEAETVDAEEDAKYGKGKRADELPEELRQRKSRLAKIQEAKRTLECEAKLRARYEAEEAEKTRTERAGHDRESGRNAKRRGPKPPDPEQAEPASKAQYNFTDPDSRIMLDGASKSFEQAYNAQIAVDAEAQIIVANSVTQQAADVKQLIPVMMQTEQNVGRLPDKLSADAGYFSKANLSAHQLSKVDMHVPPGKCKHHDQLGKTGKRAPKSEEAERMREKLKTPEGNKVYSRRKAIVEPVFGQIKECMHFRRFSF